MALSRPVVYGTLAVILVAGYVWANQDDAPAKKAPEAVAKVVTAKADSDFTAEDFSAHFDAPKVKPRSVFMPIVVPPQDHGPDAGATAKDPDGIPADLAGGDPNWTFTGYAVVNGITMALLENQSSHKNQFVNTGEHWKTSRLVSVTTGSIVLVGAEGVRHVVLRHVAKEPAATTPAAGNPAGPGAPGVPGGSGGPGGMPGRGNPGGPGGRPFNPANGVPSPLNGAISMPPGVTIVTSD